MKETNQKGNTEKKEGEKVRRGDIIERSKEGV